MYIKQLSLENLRCFAKGKLDFHYPGRAPASLPDGGKAPTPALANINAILGINGAGKSTLLNAVALAILSPVIASSGYTPYHLVRTQNKKVKKKRADWVARAQADVVLHEQDIKGKKASTETISLESKIQRKGDVEIIQGMHETGPMMEAMFDDSSPAFLMVGYGAFRRVEATTSYQLAARRKSRMLRYERVASLFEEHFALTPLSAWLPQLKRGNPGRYKQVIGLINKLLPAGTTFEGEFKDGDFLFKQRSKPIPFGALSDGYRAYIGWVGDLMYHLCMGCPSGTKLVQNKGIVLIDEIDLHIHPEWQLQILPRIAKTLPNLQFIITAHSPLVAGTLEAANIHTLIAGRTGATTIERPSEELHGLTTDQILRSEAFGLHTTRDIGFTRQLDQLAKKAGSGDDEASLKLMRMSALGKGAALADTKASAVPDWVKKKASAIRRKSKSSKRKAAAKK